jgi:hypothetical protein
MLNMMLTAFHCDANARRYISLGLWGSVILLSWNCEPPPHPEQNARHRFVAGRPYHDVCAFDLL